MATVRHGIDEVDAALVALLARRMRFIERAGVIKRDRSAVRDEWRKADVLAKVEASALRHGFPPDLARELWERLVEASIAHEFEVFDAGDAAGELLKDETSLTPEDENGWNRQEKSQAGRYSIVSSKHE